MILFVILLLVGGTSGKEKLDSYNVDRTAITVSGLSSGAAFATQMHVAYSGTITGMASFAGLPYYCAKKNLVTALTTCMNFPSAVDVKTLTDKASSWATSGKIDPTINMNGHKVFIWHGTSDSTVGHAASVKMEEFYKHFGADVDTELYMSAGHGQPTEDYGVLCSLSQSPYVNRCSYDGAYEALNHLYDRKLTKPDNTPIMGHFYEYDQDEFTGLLDNNFDKDGGFAYIPSGCTDKNTPCKLHLAFHGCTQGREFIDEEYVQNAGYLEVGEINNIIMVFPQIKSSVLGGNANGCWDWWGYTDSLVSNTYATKSGSQMTAVKRMIDRLDGDYVTIPDTTTAPPITTTTGDCCPCPCPWPPCP